MYIMIGFPNSNSVAWHYPAAKPKAPVARQAWRPFQAEFSAEAYGVGAVGDVLNRARRSRLSAVDVAARAKSLALTSSLDLRLFVYFFSFVSDEYNPEGLERSVGRVNAVGA